MFKDNIPSQVIKEINNTVDSPTKKKEISRIINTAYKSIEDIEVQLLLTDEIIISFGDSDEILTDFTDVLSVLSELPTEYLVKVDSLDSEVWIEPTDKSFTRNEGI